MEAKLQIEALLKNGFLGNKLQTIFLNFENKKQSFI